MQLIGFSAPPGPASITLAWEVGLVDGHTAAPHFHGWRQAEGGAWKRLAAGPIGPASNDGIRTSYNYEDLPVTAGQAYLYELRSTEGDLFGPWQVSAPDVASLPAAADAATSLTPLLAPSLPRCNVGEGSQRPVNGLKPKNGVDRIHTVIFSPWG